MESKTGRLAIMLRAWVVFSLHSNLLVTMFTSKLALKRARWFPALTRQAYRWRKLSSRKHTNKLVQMIWSNSSRAKQVHSRWNILRMLMLISHKQAKAGLARTSSS